jgi:hypothetical protein
MWGTIIKYAFAGLLVGIFYITLKQMGGIDSINNSLDHFTEVLKFVVGNIKNFSNTFPWVLDVIIAFTAILAIEGTLVFWKMFNWISKKYNH